MKTFGRVLALAPLVGALVLAGCGGGGSSTSPMPSQQSAQGVAVGEPNPSGPAGGSTGGPADGSPGGSPGGPADGSPGGSPGGPADGSPGGPADGSPGGSTNDSPGGSIISPAVTAEFIKMAQARNCSDVKNRLFVIDGKQMFWDVAGNCGDASYSRVLFGGSPQEKLCSVGDSIAGPITRCEDEMSRALFDTIVKNLDNADLGLTGHKVEQVAFVPKAGTVIPSHNLVIAPISGVSDARQVVIKDAASFAKLWAEHGRNRTPAPPMPYVDFSRQMVLAVFAGQKPIPCYGLAINRAVSDGEKIVVEYDIFQLQTFVACAEVESAPMEMIVVDRNDVPVEFMRVRFGEVSFTNIDQTAHSGVTEPRAEVIKDIDSWTKLWAEHAGADAPVPMVNFSKQMVLGIFLGTQPNGCYSISIEHLYKSGNALSVIPYITMPGPDKVCTMLITTPAQLIALDRSDGEVKVTPIAVPVR